MSHHVGLLMLHLLGATIWTGGHLVLALSVLPRALRAGRADPIKDFEAGFEKLGIPALVVQVVTGIALAVDFSPDPGSWLTGAAGYDRVILIKLALLLGTVALALHARLVLIPRLTDQRLRGLAWHIRGVTLLAVLFVLAGATFRIGGL